MNRLFVVGVALALSACTSVDVRPVSPRALGSVCIVTNPAVIVDDFVDVLRDGFNRHGIATSVVADQSSAACPTTLTYTALRSWDMAPYLSHAELRLWQAGHQIGYGEYHLRGKGGFALTKWQGTQAKMDPVIDQLLSGTDSGPTPVKALPASALPPVMPGPLPAVGSQPVPQSIGPATQPQQGHEPDPSKRCDACTQIGNQF